MTIENAIKVIRNWYESAEDAQVRMADKFKHRSPFSLKFRRFPSVLKYKYENDYVMRKGSRSIWINIDDKLIYIRRLDKGVAVEIIHIQDDGELIKEAECASLHRKTLIVGDPENGAWETQ